MKATCGWIATTVTLAMLGASAAPAQQSHEVPAAASPAPAAGAEATVRPGDQISVRIVREPEMSGVFTVSETGDAVLPRLGRIAVAELTAGELQDSLRSAYSVYLRDPSVEVTVLRRVGVQGEVRRPDIYMIDLTVTLRDLLAKAGGVTDAGNPNNIYIVRGDEQIRLGKDESARFRTAELRSGDQVVVGRRSWIALNPSVAVSTATGLVSFVIGIVLLVNR
jgi:protein involved in polysaccharide export with SLBB domain